MSNVLSVFQKEVPHVTAMPAKPSKTLMIDSIIGQGMEFNGEIELTNGLRIDGVFVGKIGKRACENSEVAVHIAHGGEVHGNIVADIVIIDGDVIGTVVAHKNLVVRGLIRGKAYYGETVDLSGVIEAEISRMGHTEFKELTDQDQSTHKIRSQTGVSPNQAGASSRIKSFDNMDSKPVAKTPRTPRSVKSGEGSTDSSALNRKKAEKTAQQPAL